MTDDERPWMPEPVQLDTLGGDIAATDAFTGSAGWANINRAPHDRVSGVIYKRAANIKRVRYALASPEAEMGVASPASSDLASGQADVRWVLSEQPGSQEGILAERTFRFLQDVELLPGAVTEQAAHPEWDTVLYVIAGEGRLVHRPSSGSPNLSRPLRPCDAVVIGGTELYSIANSSDNAFTGETAPLRLILLGLTPSGKARDR